MVVLVGWAITLGEPTGTYRACLDTPVLKHTVQILTPSEDWSVVRGVVMIMCGEECGNEYVW